MAFSIVQIAMSTELNPPFGDELPIKPSILRKESDRSHCKCLSFSLARDTNGNIMIAFRLESKTFLSIKSSATSVLPADVGAENKRFLPAFFKLVKMKTKHLSKYTFKCF